MADPKQVLTFEVISGPEGACLAMAPKDSAGSTRIAGPKPWGGGRVVHSFDVRLDWLVDAAPNHLAAKEADHA